jgi:hypothetical protein
MAASCIFEKSPALAGQDKAFDVVDEIGYSDPGCWARDPDSSDEPRAILLLGNFRQRRQPISEKLLCPPHTQWERYAHR